jgi:hypothetical protein
MNGGVEGHVSGNRSGECSRKIFEYAALHAKAMHTWIGTRIAGIAGAGRMISIVDYSVKGRWRAPPPHATPARRAGFPLRENAQRTLVFALFSVGDPLLH